MSMKKPDDLQQPISTTWATSRNSNSKKSKKQHCNLR